MTSSDKHWRSEHDRVTRMTGMVIDWRIRRRRLKRAMAEIDGLHAWQRRAL